MSEDRYARMVRLRWEEWHVKPAPCTALNAGVATLVDMFCNEIQDRMRESAERLEERDA